MTSFFLFLRPGHCAQDQQGLHARWHLSRILWKPYGEMSRLNTIICERNIFIDNSQLKAMPSFCRYIFVAPFSTGNVPFCINFLAAAAVLFSRIIS
jgi:hypothetical protein